MFAASLGENPFYNLFISIHDADYVSDTQDKSKHVQRELGLLIEVQDHVGIRDSSSRGTSCGACAPSGLV